MNAMSATAPSPAQHPATTAAAPHGAAPTLAIDCKVDKIYYGEFLAVRDSHVPIEKGKIIGFIGPSGCGKSTVLRSLNRMNDLIRGFRFEGHVQFLRPGHLRQVGRPGRRSAATSAWCSSSPTRSR